MIECEMPHFAQRIVMQGKHRVTRKAFKQAVFDHFFGTGLAHFFGRLKNKIDRAVKITMLGQVPGSRQQHGGMPVMTTGMHTAIVGRAMRDMILFLQRQCIQIGTQTQRTLTGPAFQNTDDTRTRDACMHLNPPGLQFLRHQSTGPVFFKTQFWVGVNVTAQLSELSVVMKAIKKWHIYPSKNLI